MYIPIYARTHTVRTRDSVTLNEYAIEQYHVRIRSVHRHSSKNLSHISISYTSQLNLIDEWTVDWSSITLGRKLGEGEFSTVHRGLIAYERIPQLRQEHFAGMSVVPVAIKVLKGTYTYIVNLH